MQPTVWRRHPTVLIGSLMLLGLIVTAVGAPWMATHDPYHVETRHSLQPPQAMYLFGTDWLGRDVFSRVIYGARVSLQVGRIVEAVAVVIGVLLGALAGFYGRLLDTLLMRITDTFMAFPSLVLAIALMAVFQKPGLTNVIIVLSLLQWTSVARVVRGSVLAVKEDDFVQSAQALGASDRRILFRHILPNGMAPVIITATIGVASNIVSEAGLSFLGFGTQPPTVSWGTMLAQGRNYLTIKPWVCIFPGLALLFTVLGLNLFGDGLRDWLDPRSR
jgi:ABC-type dipeptide/oligopeptide/nickel transport system permease subunit